MNLSKHIKPFLLAYFIGWLTSFFLVVSFSIYYGSSLKDAAGYFLTVASIKSGLLFIHILIGILYFSYLGFYYFKSVYKLRGAGIMWKRLILRLLIPVLVILGLGQCVIHQNTNEFVDYKWDLTVENNTGQSKNLYLKDGLHRGMSVFNWRHSNEEAINQLVKNNIEWVALVPYYYQKTETTKTMNIPEFVDQWTSRDSFFINAITKLHERNVHVHLKPHLWMSDGWRSDIKMDNDEEWDAWFESYRVNILKHARMAEEFNVELLCVGAEFRSSIMQQPEKWELLIDEIRNVYSGKLTYAANWDREFKDISFWDKLDYIGIQAYFPLTKNNNPSLKEIKKGWNQHIQILEDLNKKYDKPILFSEIGYRSDASATIEPWVWGSALDVLTNKKSTQTQNLAYEALFQKLWNKDWFAGVYFWQWHVESKEGDKYEEMNFSPRFKPAENTMAKWFGKE